MGGDCSHSIERNGNDQRCVAEGDVAGRVGKSGIDEAEQDSDRERPAETLTEGNARARRRGNRWLIEEGGAVHD